MSPPILPCRDSSFGHTRVRIIHCTGVFIHNCNDKRGADILPHYTTNYTEDEIILWERIVSSQGAIFYTAKGLPFVYTVKGNEIFFSRKDKSITRATVNKAYQRMKEETITGSKQLGVFGASYLLPVLSSVLSDM